MLAPVVVSVVFLRISQVRHLQMVASNAAGMEAERLRFGHYNITDFIRNNLQ